MTRSGIRRSAAWPAVAVLAAGMVAAASPAGAAPAHPPLWVAGYNGDGDAADAAASAAVDSGNHNLYVTGGSAGANGDVDYVTVAYSALGVQLWVARYDGPGNADDGAASIAVDSGTHNVYVTGSSAAADGHDDYATVAYSATGVQLWAARYDGPGGADDAATSVAVDPATHKVYVTGSSAAADGHDDYATVAYSAAGAQLWAARYNGPANKDDGASAVAVDPGNHDVFVTGSSAGPTGVNDYATVAYSAAGVPLWAARYNGPGRYYDDAVAISVDSVNHNVYVTGFSTNKNRFDYGYATLAYSAGGAHLWTARYAPDGSSYGNSIAVDPRNHNVYVTGNSGPSGEEDYATLAYGATGAHLWTARYNGPADAQDFANSVAVNPTDHNVYVTGFSAHRDGGAWDYATLAYTAAGSHLVTASYNGPGLSEPSTVVVDPRNDNVYVTGWSGPLGKGEDILTVAYPGSL